MMAMRGKMLLEYCELFLHSMVRLEAALSPPHKLIKAKERCSYFMMNAFREFNGADLTCGQLDLRAKAQESWYQTLLRRAMAF